MKVIAEIEFYIDCVEGKENCEKVLAEVFESGCESCHASGNLKVIKWLEN